MISTGSRVAAFVAASVFLIAACGGSSERATAGPPGGSSVDGAPTLAGYARPAAIGDLGVVELVGPSVTEAGRAPIFEWKSVDGAATYRLAVLAPDAPSWSWEGAATSIRYGGVDEGANGPSLFAGSHWSVAALTADGSVLALSELRPVSPGTDPGPPPTWTNVSPATPAPVASEAPVEITACDLLEPAELEALLGREFKEAEPDEVHYISSCQFRLADGDPGIRVTMNPRDRYNAEDWAGPDYEQVDGLGEDSFAANAGILKVAGFVRGEKAVTIKLNFGNRKLLEKLVEVAKRADQRLIDLEE